VNNLAKRIKRVAFGLVNFRHHRVRCLLYAGEFIKRSNLDDLAPDIPSVWRGFLVPSQHRQNRTARTVAGDVDRYRFGGCTGRRLDRVPSRVLGCPPLQFGIGVVEWLEGEDPTAVPVAPEFGCVLARRGTNVNYQINLLLPEELGSSPRVRPSELVAGPAERLCEAIDDAHQLIRSRQPDDGGDSAAK
jgi:hypothetical protein